MASFRLGRRARADLALILATSEDRWGIEASDRYAATLSAAMRKVAADPIGPLTRERTDLSSGVRSFHVRYARSQEHGAKVRNPAHILYYRPIRPGLVEIVRVLHERMEPSRHVGKASE